MTSDPVLSIRAASKTFGSRRALDAVSLDVGRGEMIALIGPSGSGKSTLLRSIDGLQTVDEGEGTITAFGGPVQARGKVSDQVRKARIRIGFIAQQFNLVGRLTLFTNVALGSLGRIGTLRGLFGAWPAETRTAAMAALHRVGVADYAAQRANTLSGGQQQRGAIARALVQRAKIVLADEPVASLDPPTSHVVMRDLQRINRELGITTIVNLHFLDLATAYADRIIGLRAGELVFDGPGSEADANVFERIYGRSLTADDTMDKAAAVI